MTASLRSAPRPPAAGGIQATFECDDLYALPQRLGGVSALAPQFGASLSSDGVRWLALGAVDTLSVPAGAGFDAAFEGLALAHERIQSLAGLAPASGLARYVGALAFDPRQPAAWGGNDAVRFVLPRVLVQASGGIAQATVLGTPRAEARALLRRLETAAAVPALPPARLRACEIESPGRRQRWCDAVGEALRAIDVGAVSKVVLARDRVVEATQAIDPWTLLRLMHQRDPYGLRFCWPLDAQTALLGASPECFLSRQGSTVSCDCLAGTIARGHGDDEQRRNAAALLASEKDAREHRIVRDGIVEAIAPFVHELEVAPTPAIMTLSEVLHLRSPIRARMRDAADFAELVASLHPTAAVGGSPRLPAMELIRALEGRPRGWYAGLIGWIGAQESQLAVAIRCGVVRGHRVTTFAGAGIVRGSDPELEWDETERKAASFLNLFADRS